jgi:hypothetical protein
LQCLLVRENNRIRPQRFGHQLQGRGVAGVGLNRFGNARRYFRPQVEADNRCAFSDRPASVGIAREFTRRLIPVDRAGRARLGLRSTFPRLSGPQRIKLYRSVGGRGMDVKGVLETDWQLQRRGKGAQSDGISTFSVGSGCRVTVVPNTAQVRGGGEV